MEFDFSIDIKQGHTNVVVDALSRKDIVENMAITSLTPNTDLMDKIILSWQQDIFLQQLIHDIQSMAATHRHYTWHQGILCRKGRLVVDKDTELRRDILLWLHSFALGGHSGRDAPLKELQAVFYWKGMTKDVKSFIMQCEICQNANMMQLHL